MVSTSLATMKSLTATKLCTRLAAVVFRLHAQLRPCSPLHYWTFRSSRVVIEDGRLAWFVLKYERKVVNSSQRRDELGATEKDDNEHMGGPLWIWSYRQN